MENLVQYGIEVLPDRTLLVRVAKSSLTSDGDNLHSAVVAVGSGTLGARSFLLAPLLLDIHFIHNTQVRTANGRTHFVLLLF